MQTSSLFYSSTSLQDIEGMTNPDLRNVLVLEKQWLVHYNQYKTKADIFYSRKDQGEPVLYFENYRIKIADQNKHLFIALSSPGQWNDHINTTVEAACKIIHIMQRLKFTLTCASLNQIYLFYVRHILVYSWIVWDG